jgi:uncharacterized membrane protein YgcG
MNRILLIISIAFLLSGCDSYKEHRKCKIQQYQTGSDASNDLLFWYLIMNHSNNSYYYYSSSVPVSNFSTVNWSQSTTLPTELNELQPISETEEPLTELPNEIEVEMEAEQGQAEASENSSTESSSETGSESSGGDSGGSSDSGGGDGGGGE